MERAGALARVLAARCELKYYRAGCATTRIASSMLSPTSHATVNASMVCRDCVAA